MRIGKTKLPGFAKLLLPLLLLFSGCFWGDEYETKHLVGHYYLDEVEHGSGAWYLHFEDENYGLADALFNCPIVEAGFNRPDSEKVAKLSRESQP